MKKHEKSGFEAAGINQISNLDTGLNNPLWQGGSMHAGMGGTVDRDTTVTQSAVYVKRDQPLVRKAMAKRARALRLSKMAAAARRGEGFYSPPCREGSNDRAIPMSWNPDGTAELQCASPQEMSAIDAGDEMDFDFSWDDPDRCGGAWDPAAVVETQALEAVGGIEGDTPGEGRLQNAMEPGIYTGKGLSDAQLTTLMRFGGAP